MSVSRYGGVSRSNEKLSSRDMHIYLSQTPKLQIYISARARPRLRIALLMSREILTYLLPASRRAIEQVLRWTSWTRASRSVSRKPSCLVVQ